MNRYFFKVNPLVLSILLFAGFLQGCASLFSSRYQPVGFHCATAGAKVITPTLGVKQKGGTVRYDKMRIYHTITVEKPGFKTTNYSFQLDKRSPTLGFMALDIIVPIYGWFYGIPLDLINPKTFKFDDNQTVPALLAYDLRKSDEKFMIVNNTSLETKGADITWHQYLNIRDYKANKPRDERSTRKLNRSEDRKDLNVDNTIFTSELNQSLKKMNFIDTTNTIFPSAGNTIYLNATIRKIKVNDVESKLGRYTKKRASTVFANDLLSLELEIEWEVLDYYKQKIYSTKTVQKSDLFTYNVTEQRGQFGDFVRSAMADNLEYSLLKIRSELAGKGLLKVTAGAKDAGLPELALPRPVHNANSRINDYLKSVAIIKVDDGHGSGVVVSADGYLVTAYHVVAGSKKIEVILNDSLKAEAEIVRKSEDADLALIKINKSGLVPMELSTQGEPEIGIDVWAIGTPKSIELGQSVSKGVLSGLRKANGISYMQTDVSINGGNSGGPLITKDGMVLGIVTSKLIGVGTEGVGFAINATEVFSKLKLAYK